MAETPSRRWTAAGTAALVAAGAGFYGGRATAPKPKPPEAYVVEVEDASRYFDLAADRFSINSMSLNGLQLTTRAKGSNDEITLPVYSRSGSTLLLSAHLQDSMKTGNPVFLFIPKLGPKDTPQNAVKRLSPQLKQFNDLARKVDPKFNGFKFEVNTPVRTDLLQFLRPAATKYLDYNRLLKSFHEQKVHVIKIWGTRGSREDLKFAQVPKGRTNRTGVNPI